MLHRHLTHDTLTPAAIDDIIECGLLADWARLAKAVRDSPHGEVASAVHRICNRRLQDEFAPRQALVFWNHYVNVKQLDVALLDSVSH